MQLNDLVVLVAPCSLGERRDDFADRVAVGRNRAIHVSEDILHLESVRLLKRALQEAGRDPETDEPLVCLGEVGSARGLDHVERKLHDDVLLRRIDVRDLVAELETQLRIGQRHRAVHGLGMPRVVVRVVCERADGEREFVDVPGVAQQRLDEVAGADVVQEVAEESAAERVVPEILDDRTAVGERTRAQERVGVRTGKAPPEQRFD